ncbi:MAG: rhamnulokinase, partial [Verrucomicrobiae bacterium]|nr:rhamnulokinase [Verrucomicrobiae bacterium]
SKNELLNQFTANATGLPVLSGPAEATAIGNMLVQALALGQLESHDQLRKVVRESFPVTRYEPQDAATWQIANERFKQLPKT